MTRSPREPEARSKTQWARASDLFLELADLDEATCADRLSAVRLESAELAEWVEALLAEDPGTEPIQPKRTFGPYVEVQRIGSGGMGEVFLAHRADGSFERQVAVKLLRAGTEGPLTTERFLRERRTLASLEHESIVRLIDAGTTDEGRPFLVMEYVDGESLDAYVRASSLDLRARLHLFCRVLDAVAYAHERGVIHRDLKPSNILIRSDGAPRLVDFGIARVEAEDSGSERPLTRTGARMFTPDYASPEQVRGERVTAASDVFSLGVLLYRLVTDHSPWPADVTVRQLEEAVLQATPPLPSRRASEPIRRSVKGDLDTLILKCLEASPERRYPDARTLQHDLERFLGGETVRARRIGLARRSVRWWNSRRWHAAAAAAGGLALVALVWIAQSESQRAERVDGIRAAMPERLQAIGELGARGLVDEARLELASVVADFEELDGDRLLEFDIAMIRARHAVFDGDIERSLGITEEASEMLRPGDDSYALRCCRAASHRSNCLSALGRFDEARVVLTAAREVADADLEPTNAARIGVAAIQARIELYQGRPQGALDVLATVEKGARDRDEQRDVVQAEVMGLIGRAKSMLGRFDEAIPDLQFSLETIQWVMGTGHKDVAEQMMVLGGVQVRAGKAEDALATLTTAREVFAGLERMPPQFRMEALDMLALAASATGDHDAAIGAMRENEAVVAAAYRGSGPFWMGAELRIAFLLRNLERLEPGRVVLEAALARGDAPATGSSGEASDGAQASLDAGYTALLEMLDRMELSPEESKALIALWEEAYGADHPIAAVLRS